MDRESSCSVCSNEFKSEGGRIPLLLSACGHNICSECAQKVIAATGEVNCTHCSKVSHAPLSKNFELMRSLIGKELSSSSSDSDLGIAVCDHCHNSTASVVCAECAVSTCQSCDSTIHEHETKQSHERQRSSNPEYFLCEVHVDPLNSFCSKCKQAVCSQCIATTHSRHKIVTLETAAIDWRGQLQKLADLAKEQEASARSIAQFIEQYSCSTKDAQGSYTVLRATKAAINNYFEKLHETLHQQRKDLLERVDSAFEEKVSLLNKQKETADGIATKQQAAIASARATMDCRDAVLAREFSSARAHLKKICDENVTTAIGAICDLSVPVTFEPEGRVLTGLIQHTGRVDGNSAAGEGVPSVSSLIKLMNERVDTSAGGTAAAENGESGGGTVVRSEGKAQQMDRSRGTTRSAAASHISASTRSGSNKKSSSADGAVTRAGSVDIQTSASSGTVGGVTTVKQEEERDRDEEPTEHIGRIYQTDLRYGDLYVGMKLDVLDTANRWAEAEIVDMNPESKAIQVSYLYWGDEWNEWITDITGGIAPLKTHTFRLGGPFLRGQRVEVRHTNTGQWCEGFISDVDGVMVQVWYEDDDAYAGKKATAHTTWLDTCDDLVRPFGVCGGDDDSSSSGSNSDADEEEEEEGEVVVSGSVKAARTVPKRRAAASSSGGTSGGDNGKRTRPAATLTNSKRHRR